MLPNETHPLTKAYMAGAIAKAPETMRSAIEVIRALEGMVDELTRHQCKLAAEVLIERQMR